MTHRRKCSQIKKSIHENSQKMNYVLLPLGIFMYKATVYFSYTHKLNANVVKLASY